MKIGFATGENRIYRHLKYVHSHFSISLSFTFFFISVGKLCKWWVSVLIILFFLIRMLARAHARNVTQNRTSCLDWKERLLSLFIVVERIVVLFPLKNEIINPVFESYLDFDIIFRRLNHFSFHIHFVQPMCSFIYSANLNTVRWFHIIPRASSYFIRVGVCVSVYCLSVKIYCHTHFEFAIFFCLVHISFSHFLVLLLIIGKKRVKC